jgi:hypothetical protein
MQADRGDATQVGDVVDVRVAEGAYARMGQRADHLVAAVRRDRRLREDALGDDERTARATVVVQSGGLAGQPGEQPCLVRFVGAHPGVEAPCRPVADAWPPEPRLRDQLGGDPGQVTGSGLSLNDVDNW